MKKLLVVLAIVMLFCTVACAADVIKVGDKLEFVRDGHKVDYNYTVFDTPGGYIASAPSFLSVFPWLFGASANGVSELEYITPSNGVPKYLEYATQGHYGDFALAVTDDAGVVQNVMPKDTCGIIKLADSRGGWHVVQAGQKNAQYNVTLQVVQSAAAPPQGLDYDLLRRNEKGAKYNPVIGETLKTDEGEQFKGLCMPRVYTSFDKARASGSLSTN